MCVDARVGAWVGFVRGVGGSTGSKHVRRGVLSAHTRGSAHTDPPPPTHPHTHPTHPPTPTPTDTHTQAANTPRKRPRGCAPAPTRSSRARSGAQFPPSCGAARQERQQRSWWGQRWQVGAGGSRWQGQEKGGRARSSARKKGRAHATLTPPAGLRPQASGPPTPAPPAPPAHLHLRVEGVLFSHAAEAFLLLRRLTPVRGDLAQRGLQRCAAQQRRAGQGRAVAAQLRSTGGVVPALHAKRLQRGARAEQGGRPQN